MYSCHRACGDFWSSFPRLQLSWRAHSAVSPCKSGCIFDSTALQSDTFHYILAYARATVERVEISMLSVHHIGSTDQSPVHRCGRYSCSSDTRIPSTLDCGIAFELLPDARQVNGIYSVTISYRDAYSSLYTKVAAYGLGAGRIGSQRFRKQ